MKKLVLIGLVLVSTAAGCGRGWMPFRGANCRENCAGGTPANIGTPAYNGCQDCNSGSAGYESYEGEQVIDGGYTGPVVSGQPYYGSTVPQTNVAPPMTSIPSRP